MSDCSMRMPTHMHAYRESQEDKGAKERHEDVPSGGCAFGELDHDCEGDEGEDIVDEGRGECRLTRQRREHLTCQGEGEG